jgi:hypothetical protein
VTSNCHEYENILNSDGTASDVDRAAWDAHRDRCVVCTEQAEADALLRGALIDPPAIPFPSDLAARLPARRRARRSLVRFSFGARLILASYGLAAVIASVWILSHIEWPSRLSPGTAGLVMILLVAASPLLVLRRGRILMPLGLG